MRTPQDYEKAFKRMTPEQQDQIRAQVAAGVASLQQWVGLVAPLFLSAMQQAAKAAQPMIDAAKELERQIQRTESDARFAHGMATGEDIDRPSA